ncbi:hypothetical protein HRbin36_00362 [bacterium HR36]|nr:hypothetical protein HRbin36_00362 [bacterium HR36]
MAKPQRSRRRPKANEPAQKHRCREPLTEDNGTRATPQEKLQPNEEAGRETEATSSPHAGGAANNAPTDGQTLRLEWWEADQLEPHPQNWRRHPVRQKEAFVQLFREVGWAGALLYNERTGHLLDGHLRKELCRGQRVPVLVGNWSADQERKILALLDPLAALAEPDPDRWQELLRALADVDASLAVALDAFAQQCRLPLPAETLEAADTLRQAACLPPARFEVIVECEDEAKQRQVYERLTAEGYRCRVLTF